MIVIDGMAGTWVVQYHWRGMEGAFVVEALSEGSAKKTANAYLKKISGWGDLEWFDKVGEPKATIEQATVLRGG